MSGSPKVGAGGPALNNNRGAPGVTAEVSSLKAHGAVDQFQRGGSGREAAAHWGAAMRGVNQEAAGRMQLEDLQKLQNGSHAQRAEHLKTLGAEQRLAEVYIRQYRQQAVDRRNSGKPMSSSEDLAEQRHREMIVRRYQDIKEAQCLYGGGQPSRAANDQPRSINQGRQDQSGSAVRRDQPERDAFRRDDMGMSRSQEQRRGEPDQRRQQDMGRERQDQRMEQQGRRMERDPRRSQDPRMGQQDPRRDNDLQRSQEQRRSTSNVVRPAEFNPHIPDDLRRLEASPQTRVDIHQYEYSLQTGMAHSSPEERHQQRQEKLTSLRDTAKEIERIASDPRHANKHDQMVDHADRLGVIAREHAHYDSTSDMARHMRELAERYDRQGKVEQACWNYEQSRETIGRKPSNQVSRDEWEDYVSNRNRAAGELLKWHRDRERNPGMYCKIDLEPDRAEEIQKALHQAHERGRRMAEQKQQSSRNLLQAYRARREAAAGGE